MSGITTSRTCLTCGWFHASGLFPRWRRTEARERCRESTSDKACDIVIFPGAAAICFTTSLISRPRGLQPLRRRRLRMGESSRTGSGTVGLHPVPLPGFELDVAHFQLPAFPFLFDGLQLPVFSISSSSASSAGGVLHAYHRLHQQLFINLVFFC